MDPTTMHVRIEDKTTANSRRFTDYPAWIIDKSSSAAATLGGLIMLGGAFIINYEIFCRHFLDSPTSWTLQVCIYIVIWFAFISLAYVQKNGQHIKVDLLLSNLAPQPYLLWEILGLLFTMIFISIFSYFSYDFFHEAWKSEELSPDTLSAPMWITKLALLVGTGLLLLQLIRELANKCRRLLSFKEEPRWGISTENLLIIALYLFSVAVAWILITTSPLSGLITLLLLLLVGGIPIFASLGMVGMAAISILYGGFKALNTVPIIAFGALDHFGLASLPLFIMAGQILEKAGVGKELYEMCSKWMSGVPGGLGGATILACAIFSAISMSSIATAATIGLIALPELARRNYQKSFSYGVVAAGGTLGLMIPPSGTMIIYSAVTEESLGQLFMAGLFPGLILSGLFLIYSIYFCSRTGRYDRMESTSWAEKLGALKTGIWGLLAPVIVLAGIYSGIFTPLEAGAVVVLYTLTMAIIRRKIRLTEIGTLLQDCCANGGMILMIIAGAMIMGTAMTLLRVPNLAIEFINGSGMPGWVVIIALTGLYLVLGMFLDVISVMLITLPVVYPLILSLGYDGIWFAVLVTLNMEIGVITPPVGLNLYVIKGLTNAPLLDILKGVFPFFLVMLLALIIIAIFPGLSTWLPTAMFSTGGY